MKFETEYKGQKVIVQTRNEGTVTEFSSPLFDEKKYATEKQLTDAIDRYLLGERKAFKNPIAWYVPYRWGARGNGGDKAVRVTVTSVSEDGREAWVQISKGNREKVLLSRLYVDGEKLQMVLDAKAQLEKDYEAAKAKLDEELIQWEPQKEEQ